MDFENITNEDLIEMENMSPQLLTHDELYFIETSERLKNIEQKLCEILTNLCVLTSKIGNIITVLQNMDNCVLLRN